MGARFLVLLVLCGSAQAKCLGLGADSWRGEDKREHMLLGAGVAWVMALQERDAWRGMAWGTAAALAPEIISLTTKVGVCSAKDALVGIAGAAVGASLGGIYLRYNGDTVHVSYSMRW